MIAPPACAEAYDTICVLGRDMSMKRANKKMLKIERFMLEGWVRWRTVCEKKYSFFGQQVTKVTVTAYKIKA
jgi:hypothetical protein